ncbi:hypothetical protein N0V83_010977 [Neocucurbitaria cava]|uniref:RING-type domain-containing protein n=1 Tax=Neocucurbitaria cava TaxID=798079 RepID=A0A9W8XZD2_9PLEO|nr:hypothetical protein N0V83_010977 [Neocucurbitaria cava]
MGSKISKAVRPHVKAAALPVATARNDANEERARQEPVLQLPDKYSNDDINIATSTTASTTSQRRNSEPARPAAAASSANMEEAANSFSLFLEELRLRAIESGAAHRTPPSPRVGLPPPPPPAAWAPPPPGEAEVRCMICCAELPKEEDPNYTKEAIKPCRCSGVWCTSCIKALFRDACKDLTLMPPRCCVPIHLHYARPYLSDAEIAEFKSKYDEWSTPHPFYCPVPTCSVFIPERLLPQQAKSNSKRTDSGIGTPNAATFGCPTCQATICAGCRQVAHPNSICNVEEFGIDAATAALLKSWGYKKCPRCGHGVKRMFGCNHMECRCGAHFCWVCMQHRDQCDGQCYEEGEDEYYSDDEPDEPDQSVAQPNEIGNTEQNEAAGADAEASVEQATSTATHPQPVVRPQNLDGGGDRYWERQDIDFGPEPTDDLQDRAWQCVHNFGTYKISLATALTSTPKVECTKCWCTIRPEIKASQSQHQASDKMVPASAGARPRGIQRVRVRDVGRYLPPRGLFRADASVGTAPHLMAPVSPLSQSVPTRETSPMEDVQYTSSDRVFDTYGNIIATTELQEQRRSSLDSPSPQALAVRGKQAPDKTSLEKHKSTVKSFSEVFATLPPPTKTFSLAYECPYCNLLVCEACKDAIVHAQKNDPATANEASMLNRDSEPSIVPFD